MIDESKIDLYKNRLAKLSFQATGFSSPNPPVACLLLDAVGNIVSEGGTSQTGGPHAERVAYQNLPEGVKVDSAIVTLEPCTHYGRTPPCRDLFLEDPNLKSIAWGIRDPNPLVQKDNSLSAYSDADIQIDEPDWLRELSAEFLEGFLSRMETGRPAIFLKVAMTKEGYMSSPDLKREQISGADSSQMLSILRSRMDAVLVGPQTLRSDTPGLETRSILRQGYQGDFNGSSFFWKQMLECFHSEECIQYQNEYLGQYQPYRCFMVSKLEDLTEEFFQKQTELDKKYPERLVLFFPERVRETEILSPWKHLAHDRIYYWPMGDPFGGVLSVLGKLGVNRLLVEGGNWVHSGFREKLGPRDSIVRIVSKELSWKEGIPSILGMSGQTNQEFIDWKADRWEIERKCLQD